MRPPGGGDKAAQEEGPHPALVLVNASPLEGRFDPVPDRATDRRIRRHGSSMAVSGPSFRRPGPARTGGAPGGRNARVTRTARTRGPRGREGGPDARTTTSPRASRPKAGASTAL